MYFDFTLFYFSDWSFYVVYHVLNYKKKKVIKSDVFYVVFEISDICLYSLRISLDTILNLSSKHINSIIIFTHNIKATCLLTPLWCLIITKFNRLKWFDISVAVRIFFMQMRRKVSRLLVLWKCGHGYRGVVSFCDM